MKEIQRPPLSFKKKLYTCRKMYENVYKSFQKYKKYICIRNVSKMVHFSKSVWYKKKIQINIYQCPNQPLHLSTYGKFFSFFIRILKRGWCTKRHMYISYTLKKRKKKKRKQQKLSPYRKVVNDVRS